MKFCKFYFIALVCMMVFCSGYSLAVLGEWAIPQIIIAIFLMTICYRTIAEEL